MRTLYNIVFRLWLLLTTPFHLARAGRRGLGWDDLAQRRGSYDRNLKQALTNRHVLWLHAWTRKEISLCTHLIRGIESRLPNLKLVVSTEDERALAALKEVLPPHISTILFPMDRRNWVSRSMSVLNPEAVVLLEAHVRPNFIWRARASRTPVFLVCARGSYRKRRRYRWLPFVYRQLFASFSGVAVQQSKETPALLKLGCRPEAVHVVGPLPEDPARLQERYPVNVRGIMTQLGVESATPVLVAAGVEPDEQGAILDAFQGLCSEGKKIFLVVIPAHIDRGRELGIELEKRAVKFMYRNQVLRHTRLQPGQVDCLVVNTPVESRQYFGRAAVVMAGRTLSADHGQGLLDAAAAGKPVILRPDAASESKAAELLVKQNGAVVAQTPQDLRQALGSLLEDDTRRKLMGNAALLVSREVHSAIQQTVDMILEHLNQDELYVAPELEPTPV